MHDTVDKKLQEHEMQPRSLFNNVDEDNTDSCCKVTHCTCYSNGCNNYSKRQTWKEEPLYAACNIVYYDWFGSGSVMAWGYVHGGTQTSTG